MVMMMISKVWRRLWLVAALVILMAAVAAWDIDKAAVALGSPQVPAMFVFGDSLVDNGNNNYLSSLAKANYYPYGCDFNGGPSGRFTNGRTFVDMLGD